MITRIRKVDQGKIPASAGGVIPLLSMVELIETQSSGTTSLRHQIWLNRVGRKTKGIAQVDRFVVLPGARQEVMTTMDNGQLGSHLQANSP